MPRYMIYFTATASTQVVVEAEDKDAAYDEAWNAVEFPYFPGGMDGDLGEWQADDDVWEMDV